MQKPHWDTWMISFIPISSFVRSGQRLACLPTKSNIQNFSYDAWGLFDLAVHNLHMNNKYGTKMCETVGSLLPFFPKSGEKSTRKIDID